LKVAVVENGAVWLGLLLDRLAYSYKKMPHLFLDDPVEVVRRNIYISPFWDEDIGSVIELIGADHVLFGSDYPHPEGLAEPVSYVNELDGLSEDIVRKVMGENLARLMQPEAAHA
jgi:predicted TIM-barrel fold metal-dependent hydrolase